jgi:hypothetical protein
MFLRKSGATSSDAVSPKSKLKSPKSYASNLLSGFGNAIKATATATATATGVKKPQKDPKVDEAAAKERRKRARARRKAKSLDIFDRIEESVDEGSVLLDISDMSLKDIPQDTARYVHCVFGTYIVCLVAL